MFFPDRDGQKTTGKPGQNSQGRGPHRPGQAAMDRHIFFYSFLVTFFINAFSTLFFLFPAALQQQAMPLSLIGWLMGVAGIGSLLGRPLGSYMTERVGIKRSLLILCLALTAVSLPLIWERTFLSLFFIRAAIGSLFGMAVIALMAYQALVVPVKKGAASTPGSGSPMSPPN